ncbi:hypothetical protein GCK72_001351 [Caenorhabditis remanei]|uniref:Uncharacterized protein n=1 Tax=Caenorhabditis remanei TaxID=31234 RepID=A0A6A5HSA9_CAERE|nr:hypothetical protein GCK72_001351 [Caenorhabditis remanei]KAF1769534.1 hypothetical protein GCK72_001351 [Caenorhabditis remanei]
MADTSIRSTHSNISRGARPESGRLHRKYPYRWLFDQVHVKSLIFHVEVSLLAAAIVGLYNASQMTPDEQFDPISVPGFDGFSATGEIQRKSNGLPERPNYMISRNLINVYSYFLIFSAVTGFLGMRLSETSITRRKFPQRMNPVLLLVPSTISVITFMYPLFIWTLRAVHSTIKLLIFEKLKISIVLDSCRLTLFPIIMIWAIYVYFLYGFWLGVLYYQRRGDPPTPTTHHDSPFRRPVRRSSLIRFHGKAGVNLLSDLNSVTNELSGTTTAPQSTSSHCVLSISSNSISSAKQQPHNRSVSPRSFRHLETVDEEAQSRTSSEC